MDNSELPMEDRLRIRCEAYELQINDLKIQLGDCASLLQKSRDYEGRRTLENNDLNRKINALVNSINGTSTNDFSHSEEVIGKAITKAMDARHYVDTLGKEGVEGIPDGQEKRYDEIIAPKLAKIADQCKELGMVMVARVEWEPGEAGITQIGDNKWSGDQLLAWYAAHARGNIDVLCMNLSKEKGAENSIVLAPFVKKGN